MESKKQVEKYFEQMKKIQIIILSYLENDNETFYQNFIQYYQDQKIQENKQQIKAILYLLEKIAKHHHRSNNFFEKIEKILIFLESSIKQSFSNKDIFNIFKGNKRILLFLIDQKIIIPDSFVARSISNGKYKRRKYPEYFCPEFKEFLNTKVELFENNPDEFQNLRRIGENEHPICQIIRKDSLEEFISYIEKHNISLTTHFKPSVFETNSFLLKREPSLIQYSAFFGSYQIFKYLMKRINEEYIEDSYDVKYCNDDLYDEYKENLMWLYSIHGNNPMIMKKLKNENYKPKNNSFLECYIKSIKCHHFDITKSLEKVVKDDIFSYCLKYFNFNFLHANFFGMIADYFYDFCKNDYEYIVGNILKDKKLLLTSGTIFT